jgi:hypothetical protein
MLSGLGGVRTLPAGDHRGVRRKDRAAAVCAEAFAWSVVQGSRRTGDVGYIRFALVRGRYEQGRLAAVVLREEAIAYLHDGGMPRVICAGLALLRREHSEHEAAQACLQQAERLLALQAVVLHQQGRSEQRERRLNEPYGGRRPAATCSASVSPVLPCRGCRRR